MTPRLAPESTHARIRFRAIMLRRFSSIDTKAPLPTYPIAGRVVALVGALNGFAQKQDVSITHGELFLLL